jgi:hypothetical protein
VQRGDDRFQVPETRIGTTAFLAEIETTRQQPHHSLTFQLKVDQTSRNEENHVRAPKAAPTWSADRQLHLVTHC